MVRKKKHKTPYLQAFWQVGCLIGVETGFCPNSLIYQALSGNLLQ